MHRGPALVAMTVLVVLFTLGVIDYVNAPYSGVIAKPIFKLVEAILIGVCIVLIATGLKRNGENE